jgi:hypothetical protein
MALQLTAETRSRGIDVTVAAHAVIRSHARQDRTASWRDSPNAPGSNCTDTLDAQRPLRRHSETGVTAVLVQARKEATADAHRETVRSQAPAQLRSARAAFP